jgi:prenyltransferase beta subunit
MSAAVSQRHETAPKGAVSGEADLWCTYAAVRTLAWLDRLDAVASPELTSRYLISRRSADGGYAWSSGMPSDAWATYYCTQALARLPQGAQFLASSGDAVTAWLEKTWDGQAFAMMPGQTPDVWATYYSVRTVRETCPQAARLRGRLSSRGLLSWLRGLQAEDGGLAWTPAHADRGGSDVRASYYGVIAWLTATQGRHFPWEGERLVGWLQGRQSGDGGFTLNADSQVPCLWATFRAAAALGALGAAPARPGKCAEWIRRLRGARGGFVRWDGYEVEDVWAAFCAIGALRALGVSCDPYVGPTLRRLSELSLPTGGYTYREPEAAADALCTAAAALDPAADPRTRTRAQGWLERCLLPNEGGVMYMPGRGAEVRCTLWAVTAGACTSKPNSTGIAAWLQRLQNPDGGFGYWEGRGSDVISTAAAVETLRLLGERSDRWLDAPAVVRFLGSCLKGPGVYAPVPVQPPTLRATLQSARTQHALNAPVSTQALATVLEAHRVRGGGYANSTPARVPDLLSTYEAVVTTDRLGVELDPEPVRRFLARVACGSHVAWTPLSPAQGNPLADCLGSLLACRLSSRSCSLPALVLS